MTTSLKKLALITVALASGSGCSSQTRVDQLKSMGSEGQHELYYYYMKQKDTPNHKALAVEHLKNAAQQGNTSAQFTYATVLEKLQGRKRAAPWYKLSSNSGIGHAHIWLGNFYFDSGETEKSIEYYEKAEGLGYVDAIYALGRIHQQREEWEKAYTKYKSLELINYKDSKIQAMKVAFNIAPLRVLELSSDTRRIR